MAVALLGGITHQTLSVCWPARSRNTFGQAFRAVNGMRYTIPNICFYLITTILGGIIYPAYRLAVRTYVEAARLNTINGTFEVKEQFVAVGVGMLPLYWLVWRQPLDPKYATARAVVTAMLCFIVWYGFLAGHILNNVRGLYGR